MYSRGLPKLLGGRFGTIETTGWSIAFLVTTVCAMQKFVVVSTTSGDHAVAEQIAADLVDRRLIACAQITGPIKSIYRWEGTVEFSDEVLLQMKTSTDNVTAVKEAISRLHPYDVPELIVVPIIDGSDSYLDWLRKATQPE